MGKGDNRRPTAVTDQAFADNWCRTWGHRWSPVPDHCLTCKRSALDIMVCGEMDEATRRAAGLAAHAARR